jgi:uncharacterized protein DUF4242
MICKHNIAFAWPGARPGPGGAFLPFPDSGRRLCAVPLSQGVQEDDMALRRFIVERDIPKVGTLQREELRGAAATSNQALRQLGPDIQWVESFVGADKTFCVYLARTRPSSAGTRRSAAFRRPSSPR